MNIWQELQQYRHALYICQLIYNAGGEVRFIGGVIRDIIAKKNIIDIDLATNLLPDQLQEILSRNKIEYYTIGKRFGTITAIIAKQKIEITTLRKDIHCDGRHAEVKFTNNWQEDAQRRDFTINALSADIKGNVYDYFNGLIDLKQKQVRFIGSPEERIQEDFLRILRFFRFSCYFAKNIDETALIACNKYAHKLLSISAERKKEELIKIFESENAFKILPFMTEIIITLFGCSLTFIDKFHKLESILKSLNFHQTYFLFFAILISLAKNPKHLIKNFAFTRSEQKFFTEILSSELKDWSFDSLKYFRQTHPKNFKTILLIKYVLGHHSEDDKILTLNLEKLFSQTVSPLPINGNDLIKLGIAQGEDIGKLLLVAKTIWHEQDFNVSKTELLRSLILYAAKN